MSSAERRGVGPEDVRHRQVGRVGHEDSSPRLRVPGIVSLRWAAHCWRRSRVLAAPLYLATRGEPGVILLHPIYLMLLLPLVRSVAIFAAGSGSCSRILRAPHCCSHSISLAVLALAGLTIRLPRQAGTVVVIADRSHSLPPDSETCAEGDRRPAPRRHDRGRSACRRLVRPDGMPSSKRTPSRQKFAGFIGKVGPRRIEHRPGDGGSASA